MSLTSLRAGPTYSVMLSPSKKSWLDQECFQDDKRSNAIKPTRNQLWKWCLRADAVAQCFVRDVMQLKEDSHENRQDVFWWLGSVPCRNVKFVGMLVGAKAYEKRTIYTIDDGTGALQCVHPHPQSSKVSKKPKESKYGPSAREQHSHGQVSEFPAPRYEVGDILRVSGRVEAWHDTRQIMINDIQLCWANDEPQHWTTTAKLHSTYYSQPFAIPPLPVPPVPQTPIKPRPDACTFATPSTTSTNPTPSSAATPSSICDASESGPSRLRHPSRLRSKELIASTFKIYLKNYIDILSDPSGSTHSGPLTVGGNVSSFKESPTTRTKHYFDGEILTQTPTPKCRQTHFLQELNNTPRPSQWHAKHKDTNTHTHLSKGFTLSYLRRVPELAEMAHRVVENERKRRSREQRQRQKEAARSGRDIALPKQPPAEPASRKAKRLYMWALRELHKEGSIILHENDAPVWEFPEVAKTGLRIWKTSYSDHVPASVDTSDITATTICSLGSSTVDESRTHWDPGELSDPPAREESYIPLTPTMLMDPVMDAIKGFITHKPHAKRITVQQSTGTYLSRGSKAVGPTAQELREYLSNLDERWENVGEYIVKDALELLKKEDRVYRVGNGRWELSL
ncbi:hypothetical protein JB92DRAFT_3045829 [Gautieria morchelliformis]|nr:hypothetical protein JB92DRAFT_3045829 [Gautieria morchelliformis]